MIDMDELHARMIETSLSRRDKIVIDLSAAAFMLVVCGIAVCIGLVARGVL